MVGVQLHLAAYKTGSKQFMLRTARMGQIVVQADDYQFHRSLRGCNSLALALPRNGL
jgi:hypothetical protein